MKKYIKSLRNLVEKYAALEKVINDDYFTGHTFEELRERNYNIYEEFDYSYGTRRSKGFKTTNMIQVTTKDFDVIGRIIDLAVDAGATGVSSINFELSEESNDNDFVIERSSVKVFIDKVSLQKINGSELDYLDALSGAGFKINNPQAKSVCGCGVSFN